MTLKVGYVQAACPTTATTVDFTDADAGFSSDVKAAIFFGTHATATDTSTDDARLSIGFAASNSGTTQAAMALFSDDAIVLGTTVTARYQGSSYAYAKALTTGGAPVIAGDVSSWLSTGARLNITTADGTAPLISALLLGGDIEAKVVNGVFATGTPNDCTIAHGLTGTPDLVFGFTSSNNTDDTGATIAEGSFFFWERIGGVTVGQSFKSPHGTAGATTMQSNARSTDFYDNANNYALTVNSVGGTNVVLRTNADTAYDKRWYLLCVRGSSTQITTKAGVFDMPTGTGVSAVITSMAVAPQVLLTLQSNMVGALPTVSTGAAASILGFGAAITNSGGIKQGAVGFFDEDNQSTTDSESRTSTKAIFIPLSTTGNVSADADLSSFDSGGVSINVTTAGLASHQMYLAFGMAPASAAPYVQPLPMRIVRHSGRYV